MPDAHPPAEKLSPVRAAALILAVLAESPAAAAPDMNLNVIATYEARMLVKVGDLRTDTVVGPGAYRLGARLTTIGAMGVIKPNTLLDQADGTVHAGAPTPVVFIQTEKGKRRVVRYNGGSGWRSLADPLTQLMRAELQPGSGSPCLGSMPVYDGRQRYDLGLYSMGGGALAGPAAGLGLTRPVSCRFGFHAISGFGGSKRGGGVNVLRGDPVATFGFHPGAQVWVLTDIAVPTILGTGHIALTSARISGTRPVLAGPPAAAKPPAPQGSKPR